MNKSKNIKFPSPRERVRERGIFKNLGNQKYPSLEFVSSLAFTNKFFSLPRRDKLFAFTLAEVLVTLGVIGVVAAMTINSVIHNIRNVQLGVAFKKSYSTLSQAINMYQADTGEVMLPQNIAITKTAATFQKYIKKSGDIDTTKVHYRNYPNNYVVNSIYNVDAFAKYITADGSFLYLFRSYADVKRFIISVDVNGYKKPNRLGYDLFVFYLDENGRLLPMGTEGSSMMLCNNVNVSDANGAGCTIKALYDKNYFKNLP